MLPNSDSVETTQKQILELLVQQGGNNVIFNSVEIVSLLRKKKINHLLQHIIYMVLLAMSMEGRGGRQETKILINLVRLMNRRLVTVNVTAEGQLLVFSLGN